jgi:hypothetical protein
VLPVTVGIRDGVVQLVSILGSRWAGVQAMESLVRRAAELNIPLEVVPPDDFKQMKLGLAGDHQRLNAALAVTLVRACKPAAQLMYPRLELAG